MDETWVTEAVLTSLAAIQDPHAEKKRSTVRMMAWASVVQGQAEDSIFEKGADGKRDRRVCSRSIWYEKWKHEPTIAAALDACKKALRAWKDTEIARAETEALRRVRLALAANAEQAIVGGLQGIIGDPNISGSHRLNAIDRYTQLFNADLAARIPQQKGTLPVELNESVHVVKLDVSGLPTEVLRALADEETD